MHFFWDDALGKSRKPDVVLKDLARLPRPNKRLAAIDDEAKWVDEGFVLAKTVVYAPPVGVGPGPFTLNAAYKKEARRVARQQVALAGARLARVINEAFK